MQVVRDRSIIEVFLDEGLRSRTALFFTQGKFDLPVLATTVEGIWLRERYGACKVPEIRG